MARSEGVDDGWNVRRATRRLRRHAGRFRRAQGIAAVSERSMPPSRRSESAVRDEAEFVRINSAEAEAIHCAAVQPARFGIGLRAVLAGWACADSTCAVEPKCLDTKMPDGRHVYAHKPMGVGLRVTKRHAPASPESCGQRRSNTAAYSSGHCAGAVEFRHSPGHEARGTSPSRCGLYAHKPTDVQRDRRPGPDREGCRDEPVSSAPCRPCRDRWPTDFMRINTSTR
ncbi:hypothetical protein BPA30113_03473 [Burkholderia paludis]|uniref:Uncharacterized protein n=1 Tax=Burkholderia paludis TaxID=1506587 RepID=A0A6P2MBR5_9BURK|nr:hypothetical protein LMG30113_02259 [Burkholderia paludis]VWB76313.1 hypothetical protein BPA30113_03473 [Burkholderia paludis]